MDNENILVVDDDVEVRTLVADVLSDEGYTVHQASNESEAMNVLKNNDISLVFLDLWIGEDESAGLKILNKIKKTNFDIPVVIISGHGTVDVAVKAIHDGAFDFIEKPFVIDRLLITTNRAIETYKLKTENSTLKNSKLDLKVLDIGDSSFAQNINTQIKKIGELSSRVFIKAESGSGSNIVAYAIHKASPRRGQFMYVNCSTNDEQKLENDLFGNDGAYGYLEKANRGTLYLEDISNVSKNIQRRLLEFFQNGYFMAGQRRVFSDVRIISSSNFDIDKAISNNDFISELFYRLSVSQIEIPPLRERKSDIIPLLKYFISKSDMILGRTKIEFSREVISVLQSFDWSGNIYQLRNVVENMLINLGTKTQITTECLPSEILSSTNDKYQALDVMKLILLPLKQAKEMFESDYLRAQINRFSGNISKTAEFVGMERSALHRKLKYLNVDVIRKHKDEGNLE